MRNLEIWHSNTFRRTSLASVAISDAENTNSCWSELEYISMARGYCVDDLRLSKIEKVAEDVRLKHSPITL